jgi:hypothetical protein
MVPFGTAACSLTLARIALAPGQCAEDDDGQLCAEKTRLLFVFFSFLISNLAPRTRAPLDPAQPRLPFHDLVTHLCDFSSFCHFFEARENLVVSSHFLLVLSPPTPPAYMRLTRFRGQARCLPRSFRIAASSILHLFRATPEALVPRVTQGTVCGKIRCGQRV